MSEPHFHPTFDRTVPARRPDGFTPKNVRYSLRWRRAVPTLIADWIGLQGADIDSEIGRRFVHTVQGFLSGPHRPESSEVMVCAEDETGRPAVIVVAYWTDPTAHAKWSHAQAWTAWWNSEQRLHDGVGYWRETIVCPYERHETAFSREHYRIGFARVPDTDMVQITDNGYFGAARDRLPISAIDKLESPLGTKVKFDDTLQPKGRRVIALTPLNTTVIRSGQFWHDSEPEQADDYENALRPKLDRGMDYIAGHQETGCIYLRRMTNLDEHRQPRRETSVYAVFQELAGLETWAADHETHRAIWGHQVAMGLKYGDRRDVITWHEVFVLLENNRFEYINCAPGTGMTRVGTLAEIPAGQPAQQGR